MLLKMWSLGGGGGGGGGLQTFERHVPEGNFQASCGSKDLFHLLQAVLRGLLGVALALQVGYMTRGE